MYDIWYVYGNYTKYLSCNLLKFSTQYARDGLPIEPSGSAEQQQKPMAET